MSDKFEAKIETKGSKITASQLPEYLELFYQSTKEFGLPMPVCIWGNSGLGKTEVIEQYAKNNKYGFVYLSPAQFEEVGDLGGLPEKKVNEQGQEYTTSTPPEWFVDLKAQFDSGKERGVLLLDDFNRADKRIMTALMQVLQRYAFHNWQIPKTWQIIVSANPEGKAYSVTKMDDAVSTRFLHLTFLFTVQEWADYAKSIGLHDDVIDFAFFVKDRLEHTVNATVNRTINARSYTNFGKLYGKIVEKYKKMEELPSFKGLKNSFFSSNKFHDEIYIAWYAAIGELYYSEFSTFLTSEKNKLINIEDILNSLSIKDTLENLGKILNPDGKGFRGDLLYIIIEKLRSYAKNLESKVINSFELPQLHTQNLIAFMLWDAIPADNLAACFIQLQSFPKTMKSVIYNTEVMQKYSKTEA